MARKDATTLVAMLEGALGHYFFFFFAFLCTCSGLGNEFDGGTYPFWVAT